MPVCEGCGGSFSDEFQFCPHCGRAKPATPTIKIEHQVLKEPTPFDCPLCKNQDSVQKVSSIVDAGTSKGIATAHSSGTGTIYQDNSGRPVGSIQQANTSHSSSFNQSNLAKKLSVPSPPFKPVKGVFGSTVVIVISIILYLPIMGMIGNFDSESFISQIFLNCCVSYSLSLLLTFIGWKIIRMITGKEEEEEAKEQEYQKQLRKFEKAKECWNNLYYCHRHDIVFLQGSKEYASSDITWAACENWTQNTPEGFQE